MTYDSKADSEFLGLEPGTAAIYISEGAHESAGVAPEDYVYEYLLWHLVMQPEKYRKKRGAAAGLLIVKREVVLLTGVNADEWANLSEIMLDAPGRLCEAAGVTFTGHFTGPAFNNGPLAGQTQAQVHGHIYPVIEEQLPPPGVRNGMGAAMEALRAQNTGS